MVFNQSSWGAKYSRVVVRNHPEMEPTSIQCSIRARSAGDTSRIGMYSMMLSSY